MKYPRLKNESLFELIHALSGSEIRYFKLHASLQGGDKGYITLFDEIKRQKSYDEEYVKQKFKNKRFTNNLHIVKRYLYESILKSLRMYDKETSIYNELSLMSHNIKLLYNKSLYEQCKVLIAKMKILAEEAEWFEFIGIAFNWELEIIYATRFSEITEEIIEDKFKEYFEVFSKMKNLKEFFKLRMQMTYSFNTYGVVRNREQELAYKKIMSSGLMSHENKAKTIIAKQWFNDNYITYGIATLHPEMSYVYSKKALSDIENSEKGKGNAVYYVAQLINAAGACLETERFGECLSIVDTVRLVLNNSGKKFNSQRLLWLYCGCYEREFRSYFFLGNLKKSEQKFKEAERFIDKNKEELKPFMTANLFYWMSCNLLMNQEYKLALKYLNRSLIYRQEIKNNRTDSPMKILQLIIHIELNNQDILPYITRSIYRSLLKRDALYKAEKCLLNFIRVQIPKIKNHQQLIKAYKDLQEELTELKKIRYESPFFVEFDLISWLESKIKNKPFVEAMRVNNMDKSDLS